MTPSKQTHAPRPRCLLTCALLLLATSVAPAATDLRRFPFVKQLKADKPNSTEIASFRLDPDIFAATDDIYSNLRIIDQTHNEVPFLVRPVTKPKKVINELKLDMTVSSFENLADNSIEIIVTGSRPERPLSAVIFTSPVRNFEKAVSIAGSNDKNSWLTLADQKPIFDYTRYLNLRNNRIDFAPSAYAFYKINISNISEAQQSPFVQITRNTDSHGQLQDKVEMTSLRNEVFQIRDMTFIEKQEYIQGGETVKTTASLTGFSTATDPKARQTAIEFNSGRIPISSVRIIADDPNFSRKIKIEASAQTNPDQSIHITSSVITRISLDDFRQEAVTVPLPRACRYDQYRITISNLDSPPLNISRIESQNDVQEAVFFHKSGSSYRAFYGGPSSDAQKYDIADILARAKQQNADTYTTGPQENNPTHKTGAGISVFESRKIVIASIILLVMTLGWLIARCAKQINTLPP